MVISSKDKKEQVIETLKKLALGEERCKERTKFTSSLADYGYDKDVVGWFDLCNYFMFFKDKEMWENWSNLFGL